jgi:hypothetical protein
VDSEHVKVLAAIDGPLPPITVHDATLRVIDGAHRVHAARLRGEDSVRARLFHGDEAAAYVLSVQLNVTHGRPLSRSDRLAAAQRMVALCPRWSDRRIAVAAGVGAAAVTELRERSTARRGQMNVREGRDGRLRPLSAEDGRLRAARILAEEPAAPLRRVAAEAGIALGTAKDVRDRLRAGRSPLPDRYRSAPAGLVTERLRPPAGMGAIPGRACALAEIGRDPTLRYSESGRRLLALLTRQPADDEMWQSFADAVPAYRRTEMAHLARGYVAQWARFVELLEARITPSEGGS